MLPWWLLIVLYTFAMLFAGVEAQVIHLPPPQPIESLGCSVHVKVTQVRVLADMGDGLFDGKMEVQLAIAVSDDSIFQQRLYPNDGSRKISQGDTLNLDNFTFSVRGVGDVQLFILAVEKDDLPRIAGIDIGQALLVIGEGVGGVVTGVFEFGVGALRDAFAADDIITDTTITLPKSTNWNVGYNHYQTDNIEVNYYVSYSGC